MIINAKHEILAALFVEYQKDIPEFNSIKMKFKEEDMDPEVFNVAILKLINEGYIHNVDIIKGGRKPYGIQGVRLENALLTGQTARYLEEKLDLELTNDTMTGEEKSKNILKRFADSGIDRAENIIAKIIAELIKA